LATPELAENAEEAAENARVATTDAFSSLEQADPAPIVLRSGSDPAALLYTGGTTGRAKGVLLSHENLWFAGKAGHDAGHVPGIVRGLSALPLSHSYGLLVTVVGFHAVEQHPSVLMRWFDPGRFLELAQEHRTQITAVVPSMLQLLLALPVEDYDLSELRYVVSGGAPLPPEVAEALLRRRPPGEVRAGDGLTERGGGALAAAAAGRDPRGLRPDGDVGARHVDAARPSPARLGRQARSGDRGPH